MPKAPEAERLRRTALAVLATVFSLNLLARGSGETYTVFLLPLEREFGWSRSQLTSVFALCAIFAAALPMWVVRRLRGFK